MRSGGPRSRAGGPVTTCDMAEATPARGPPAKAKPRLYSARLGQTFRGYDLRMAKRKQRLEEQLARLQAELPALSEKHRRLADVVRRGQELEDEANLLLEELADYADSTDSDREATPAAPGRHAFGTRFDDVTPADSWWTRADSEPPGGSDNEASAVYSEGGSRRKRPPPGGRFDYAAWRAYREFDATPGPFNLSFADRLLATWLKRYKQGTRIVYLERGHGTGGKPLPPMPENPGVDMLAEELLLDVELDVWGMLKSLSRGKERPEPAWKIFCRWANLYEGLGRILNAPTVFQSHFLLRFHEGGVCLALHIVKRIRARARLEFSEYLPHILDVHNELLGSPLGRPGLM